MPKKITRGMRNNNPLNIKFNVNNNWKREVRPSSDPVFCQFLDMSHGFRAAMLILRKYIISYHLTDVSSIIQRFAPASENDTRSYVSFVWNRMVRFGYNPADIQVPSKDFFCMVDSMALYESKVDFGVQRLSEIYYDLC